MKQKINYPVKRMRLSESNWKNLTKYKNRYGKSWNLFQMKLLEVYKKSAKDKR